MSLIPLLELKLNGEQNEERADKNLLCQRVLYIEGARIKIDQVEEILLI
jgi:hypothetical protein